MSHSRFGIDLYSHKTLLRTYGCPENSYSTSEEEIAIKCLADLIKNKNSGIYRAELTLNDFADDSLDYYGVEHKIVMAKILERILKHKEALPLLLGIDPILDRLIEEELKKL